MYTKLKLISILTMFQLSRNMKIIRNHTRMFQKLMISSKNKKKINEIFFTDYLSVQLFQELKQLYYLPQQNFQASIKLNLQELFFYCI
jgi:hypothetical protein